jgi:hypothetical protein
MTQKEPGRWHLACVQVYASVFCCHEGAESVSESKIVRDARRSKLCVKEGRSILSDRSK